MLYCCGGRGAGEPERAGEALRSGGAAGETPAAGVFEMADLPELLPSSGQLQPSPRGPARQLEDVQRELKDCPQRRSGQRAPKLGQIGRSKRVVIEDEDLDDVLNNNGDLLVPLSNEPS